MCMAGQQEALDDAEQKRRKPARTRQPADANTEGQGVSSEALFVTAG